MNHKQGAIHFVANNNLKFEDGPKPLFVRPSSAAPVQKKNVWDFYLRAEYRFY